MKVAIVFSVLFSLNVAFAAYIAPKHYISAEEAERIAKWTPGDKGNPWQMSGQYQGDMILNDDQKNGVIDTRYRWPDRTLVYQFDSSVSQSDRDFIRSSLEYFNTNTCVTVRERTNENDYVLVTTAASGCWSYVGRIGGGQGLNLQSNGCIYNYIVLHEFLHALGFEHMHQNYDRDDFVQIFFENVQSGLEYAFDKYSSNDVTHFGEAYDMKSVMHYDEYAFSFNGQPTIKAYDGTSPLGNSVGLTQTDYNRLQKMYDCPV